MNPLDPVRVPLDFHNACYYGLSKSCKSAFIGKNANALTQKDVRSQFPVTVSNVKQRTFLISF